MATVIDELVVTLGLDPSKFTEGQKAALESFKKLQGENDKAAKDTEQSGKRIGDVFSTLKRQVIGLTAAVLGGVGFKEMIANVADLDAKTGRLAYTLGISAKELSTWQTLARLTGGSTEAMSGSINGLSQEMQKFQLNGQGAFVQLFDVIDVTMFRADRSLKSATEMARDISKALVKPGADIPRIAALLSMVPGMSQDMMNALLLGPAKLDEYLKRAEKLGATTEDSSRAAQELNTAWAETKTAAADVARVVMTELTPALVTFFRVVTGWMTDFRNSFVGRMLGLDKPRDQRSQSQIDTWSGKGDRGFGTSQNMAELWKWANTPLFKMPTRGDRNNNPGNIEYGPFAISRGAVGTDGRFAIFPTKETGEKAMDDLLQSRSYRGLNLAQIQRKWVGNDDIGYLGSMMKSTGLGAMSIPDMSDPAVRRAIMQGMTRGEGTSLSGAATGAGAAAAISSITNRGGDRTVTKAVTFGDVHFHTDTTTADGIQRNLRALMDRANFAASANNELN